MNILGFSGSLRSSSVNTALLGAAAKLAPEGVSIELFDISKIPLYNEDLREQGEPASVVDFGKQLSEADAILIATPEYNYSFSGVIKNAIDWASRLPDKPFAQKPVAIFGASPSHLGTARAQYQLRQCFVYLDSKLMNQPECMVSSAHTVFDAEGVLTDEKTASRVKAFVAAFVEHAQRCN